MNQLWQQKTVRDYFGVWSPPAIRNLDVLNNPGCFRPSFYATPKFRERVLPENGYRQAQVQIAVGGYIYGITRRSNLGDPFQVLITDLSLNRPLCNAPVDSNAFEGDPYILPDIYPVTGNGNFRVEMWNTAGNGDLVVEVVLHVVEPKGA